MFNLILREDFYDEIEFDINDFEEELEWYYFSVAEEPLFNMYNSGEQLSWVVFNFLKEVPEAELEASYSVTFNNCGDEIFTKYEYKDNLLWMKNWCAEEYVSRCPECDEYFFDEPPYDGSEEAVSCPFCDAKLDLKVGVNFSEIPLVDGEWRYPEGVANYDLDLEELEEEDED